MTALALRRLPMKANCLRLSGRLNSTPPPTVPASPGGDLIAHEVSRDETGVAARHAQDEGELRVEREVDRGQRPGEPVARERRLPRRRAPCGCPLRCARANGLLPS